MGTNYIAPIWRMPRNANKDKLSNYSIDFDGSAYINCGNDDVLNVSTSNYSFSIWVKYTTTQNRVVMEKGANNQLCLQLGGSGFNGHITWVGGPTYLLRSTAPINDGQWHHICCVADGSSSTLYIDGQVNNTGGSKIFASNNTNNLHVGSRGGSIGIIGEMNQLCIFDYALSTSQVDYLYNLNNPMAISGAEPIAYWPLGDNSNPNAPGSFPNISVGADSVFEFVPSSSQFIDAGSASYLNSLSQFTLSCWFKLDVAENNRTIVSDWNFNNPPFGHFALQTSDRSGSTFGLLLFIKQASDSGNNLVKTGGGVFTANVWYNVIFTYNAGTVTCYKNGKPVSLTTIGTIPTTLTNQDGNLNIGKFGGGLSRYWDGEISNIAVWNSDQTAEISNIYNSGAPTTTYTNTPTVWYKLDQSANWEADTANNWQIPDNRSAYPQSFDFIDGNDTFIDCGANENILDFSGNDYTVSAWVNWDGTGDANQMIASVKSGGSNVDFALTIEQSSGKISYWNGSTYVQSNSAIPTGSWCMVTIIVKSTQKEFFINGVADGTPSQTRVASAAAGTKFYIGRSNLTIEYFNGKISNVQIFNTALPATGSNSVETLYNNGVPLTTAIATDNLKAWYKLDNTELFDSTNWSVENQKYPANYESAIEATELTGLELDSATPNLGTTQSFSWWVNYKKSSLGSYLWNKGFNGWRIYVYNNGRLLFRPVANNAYMVDTGTGVIQAHQSIGNGKWYHYVLTRDGENVVIYQNSVPVYTGTIPGTDPAPATDDINFIASEYGGSDVDTKFSNFCIFNNKLEQSDITSLYNNGTPLLNMDSFTSLQNWWKLNNLTTGLQASAGSINASVRSGTPGFNEVNTFVSTEAATSSGMTEQNLVNNNVSALNGESSGMDTSNLVQSNLTRTQPYSSYSFNFDAATNDYISIPNPGSIFAYGESAFTFSGWVSIDAYSDQDGIFGRFDNANDRSTIKLGFTTPFNSLMFLTSENGNLAYLVWDGILPNPANGEWKHICLTYDAGTVKLYLDGADQGAGTPTGTIPTTMPNLGASTQLEIARDQLNFNARLLNGRASNFCVFDRALTESEILKIYNNGVPQDLQATSSFSNNIIAWWPMDQRSSYYDGTDWVVRDLEGGKDGNGINTGNVEDMVGNAPGSEASGTGSNLVIGDLKNNMKDSTLNAHSINMGDYADGVTNPANSGKSTDVP